MKSASSGGLPPEIEAIYEPERTIYRLPRRDFGKARLFGLVPLGVGISILWWAGTFSNEVTFNNNRPFEWTDGLFGAAVILVGLGLCYVPLGLGLAILWGRREIVLRGGKLRSTERAGPFWRTKRWPIADIEQIEVIGLSGGQEPAPAGFTAKLDALAGRTRGGTRFMIAPAFPRKLLNPLARDLAKHCDRMARQHSATPPEPILLSLPGGRKAARMVTADGNDTTETVVVGAEDSQLDNAREEPLSQPRESQVQVERSATGLTLTVPPAGLRKGTKGLFTFSLIWCGGVAIFTAAFVAGAHKDFKALTFVLLILSVFWISGIAILLAAINMGRRRAVIALVGDELLVLQTSIFRSKSRQWKADEIAAVRAGPSGMAVNDIPVLELQIVPSSGAKFGLLAGRDEDELHWLADEIGRTLGVRTGVEPTADIMASDVNERPAGSRIAVETFPRGFSLTIPPGGLWRGSQGFVGLGLFLLAVMVGVTGAEIYFRMSVFAHPIGAFFTLASWGVAVAILVSGVNIGTRRAAVGVTSGRLMIAQSSLLGSKTREYEAGEVTAVRAAPGGQGKDFEGLVELQVLSAGGEIQSFLCGHDKNDLFWIATLIRLALQVPAQAVDEDVSPEEEVDAIDSERDGNELDDAEAENLK